MKFVLITIFTLFLTCNQKLDKKDTSSVNESSSEISTVAKESSNAPKKEVENVKSNSVSEKLTGDKEAISSAKVIIPFEEINHHMYPLISEKYLIINDQAKMDKVYAVIHEKSGGGRMAPIPTVNEGESYLVFKPELKNANDVEIKEIYLKGNTLNVDIKPFEDPQKSKSSRVTPNVLVKLLKKVSAKQISVNYK